MLSKILGAIWALSILSLSAHGAAQTAPPPQPVVVTTANPQTEAARSWGYADSDVPVDPDILFGVLANGMKYALQRNTTPQNAVIMRLHFDVGSFAEADDQSGLAHFLEHMAFNGSTHVPEGEMVRLLERYGLAFGADTNASTGFDQTVYQLDLPTNGADITATALMLFREIAGELTIAPAAVDRERGVILSERRARDTYALQNLVDGLDFVFAGTRAAQRMPIGTEMVIRTAPAQRIRDFYDANYRPENATLVIVGDFDVAAMEALVQNRFADWRGRGPAEAKATIGHPDFTRAATADVFTHPAIPETVGIVRTRPWVLEPDTQAQRRQDLLESIGDAIVERRLSRIALAADSPISGASITVTDTWDTARLMSLDANARDGTWADAIRVVENELRRAREFGFSDAEVAEQIAALRTSARNSVQGMRTRQSASLAARLIASADARSVVTAPAFRFDLIEHVAPTITAAQVNDAFDSMYTGFGAPLVRVTSKQEIAGGEQAVLEAYTLAAQTAVSAPEARATPVFAYTDFGSPGRLVADDRVDDLGIRRVRFANNVMLNIKHTDFEADRVRIQVRIDGGDLLSPRSDPTRLALANLLIVGGLEAHTLDELRSILAGRTVSTNFTSGTDAFSMSAVTTPPDLMLQAQVFAATITHPGYRPEAIDLLRRILPQQYAAADATPAAIIGRDVGAIIADNDPRLVTPPLSTMMALDWATFRPAIADALSHGAIEIAIVGAVDEDAAIAAIAATFGALPERRATFDPQTAARERRFAADLSPRTLLHAGGADQAVVLTYWPARDDSDLTEAIHLDMLAGAMNIMLTDELRERLGQTYSPSASSSLSSDFTGFGTISASSNVDFADIAASQAAIDAIAAQLATTPISDDLLARVRQPLVEQMTAGRRQNSYWVPYVALATSEPRWLERSRRAIALVEATTAADIQRVAARYLRSDAALHIRVISRTAPGQPGAAEDTRMPEPPAANR